MAGVAEHQIVSPPLRIQTTKLPPDGLVLGDSSGVVATATVGLDGLTLGTWLAAVAPVALLAVLVTSGRVKTVTAALATLGLAVALAAGVFRATPLGLGVGLAKGLWTGVWILGVIWSALLLYAVCQRMGLDRLGSTLTAILPRRTENVLIAAWVFPSFVQGVAGFGTPIAVSAPLLVAMGVRPVMAVALPLVGYHWAVGFGSVGSPFYMGALTARLSLEEVDRYAAVASLLLGVNAVVAGVLVALMYGGWPGLRESWRLLVLAGPAMAVTQALVVRLEPAVGALAGGTAGLAAVAALTALSRRGRHGRGGPAWVPRQRPVPAPVSAPSAAQALPVVPNALSQRAGHGGLVPARLPDQGPAPGLTAAAAVAAPGLTVPAQPQATSPAGQRGDVADPYRRLAVVMLPYGLLLVVVLSVLLPPGSRHWARSHLVWGPTFPATETGVGAVAPAVADYQPMGLFSHPGSYILTATLLAVLVWRAGRLWPRGALREVIPGWLRTARKASPGVLLLASVATIMADSGMMRIVAVGVAAVAQDAYPPMAGLVGALGSFTTGSTTSSNALFATLQTDVARLLDVPPTTLLAAQLAGGNTGNSLTPVIMLLGAAAVDARDQVGAVLRTVALPVGVLLAVIVALTQALVLLS